MNNESVFTGTALKPQLKKPDCCADSGVQNPKSSPKPSYLEEVRKKPQGSSKTLTEMFCPEDAVKESMCSSRCIEPTHSSKRTQEPVCWSAWWKLIYETPAKDAATSEMHLRRSVNCAAQKKGSQNSNAVFKPTAYSCCSGTSKHAKASFFLLNYNYDESHFTLNVRRQRNSWVTNWL